MEHKQVISHCLNIKPQDITSYTITPFDTSGIGFIGKIYILNVKTLCNGIPKEGQYILKHNLCGDKNQVFGHVLSEYYFTSWLKDVQNELEDLCCVRIIGTLNEEGIGSYILMEDLRSVTESYGLYDMIGDELFVKGIQTLGCFHRKTLVVWNGGGMPECCVPGIEVKGKQFYKTLIGFVPSWRDIVVNFGGFEVVTEADYDEFFNTGVVDAYWADVYPLVATLHGDTFVTNFLFKQDAAVLIDFQFAFWGNPLIDLAIFIFTSTSADQISNVDDWLKLYHKSLGLEYVSMDDIYNAWDKAIPVALFVLIASIDCYYTDDPVKQQLTKQRYQQVIAFTRATKLQK